MRQCYYLFILIASPFFITPTFADQSDWLDQVSTQHPRMFFNAETWPTVKQYTLKHEAKYYQRIKKIYGSIPLNPDPAGEKVAHPTFGQKAQIAAFVYLMEGNPDALKRAKNYLKYAADFYQRRSANSMAVGWYSASRVQALATYDWIYHELTPAERTEIAQNFFQHVHDALDPNRRFQRQNRGGITSGFYGPPNLPWYIGLAFYKDGIDDAQALILLKDGYRKHIELLDYRASTAGDDGGIASISTGYAFGMYPYAEYNFMHTFNSATGINLADTYTHHSLLPNWVYWNYIPSHSGGKGWGFADDQHHTNNFHEGFLELHMLQVAHFYAKSHQDRARFALWVRKNLLTNTNKTHDDYWWPLLPLFLTNNTSLPAPQAPKSTWPQARYFEAMGATFMRSGNRPGDTFAALAAGGTVYSHRHFDQGHFTIYKKGFVALDSSTYGDRSRSGHLTEYSNRSVAHNTILIRDDKNDSVPRIWGGPAKTFDGGQSNRGGKVIAFETNDQYTYIAADITETYDSRKTSQVVRQFLFVYPSFFVIFDRITSTDPNAEKAFLLHTARKPVINTADKSFHADQDQGRLFCKTIFPDNATQTVIGGKGKEFYSAGKNWDHTSSSKPSELWGNYRVEISPPTGQNSDTLLNLIHVGSTKLKTMSPNQPLTAENQQGVRFTTHKGEVSVFFNTTGQVAGSIQFPNKSPMLLTTTVQPQSAMMD